MSPMLSIWIFTLLFIPDVNSALKKKKHQHRTVRTYPYRTIGGDWNIRTYVHCIAFEFEIIIIKERFVRYCTGTVPVMHDNDMNLKL